MRPPDPQTERHERYQVIVNHEEQYSIWPAEERLPVGWKSVRKTGTERECLEYIEEVWTDMRPLDLRDEVRKMRERLESLSSDDLSSKGG